MGKYTENADKVELAESVIESLAQRKDGEGKPDMVTTSISIPAQRKQTQRGHGEEKPDMVTTSQIRKFLTAVNTVTGKIEQYRNEHGQAETLSPELAAQVKFLKVKWAYQVGRGDSKIKNFNREADLMAAIESIGNDVKKYEEFARYVEALVAFHKYRGGKD